MAKKKGYIPSKDLTQKMEKILDSLNKLDAQYLVGYPRNIPRSEYLDRRKKLKQKFMKLKKEYDFMRG